MYIGDNVKLVNIESARNNLFQLVHDVNTCLNQITIVNNEGKNAVLISEEKWKNIKETLYLTSIPGLVTDINKIREIEDWEKAKEFSSVEVW